MKKKFLIIFISACLILTAGSFAFASDTLFSDVAVTEEINLSEQKFTTELDSDAVALSYTIYQLSGGNKQPILSDISIQDEARYEPVVQISENVFLLDHRFLYDIDSQQKTKLEIPITYMNFAQVNSAKDKIAYIGKNEETSNYEVGVLDIATNSYKKVYAINPDDWQQAFSPVLYVSWKNDFEMLFDAPNKGVPAIYELDTVSGKVKQIKNNARMPVSLNDGEILSYLSTDVFGGACEREPETVIQNMNGKTITLPGYRVLKSDGESKFYIAGYGELICADVKDLKFESKKKFDEYFNFAACKNGEFQYQQIIVDDEGDVVKGYKEVKVTPS